MGFTLSINKPRKTFIIHKKGCNSIRQVIGERESDNHYYKDFETCEEVLEYCKENNFECKPCKHCKSKCGGKEW